MNNKACSDREVSQQLYATSQAVPERIVLISGIPLPAAYSMEIQCQVSGLSLWERHTHEVHDLPPTRWSPRILCIFISGSEVGCENTRILIADKRRRRREMNRQ